VIQTPNILVASFLSRGYIRVPASSTPVSLSFLLVLIVISVDLSPFAWMLLM